MNRRGFLASLLTPLGIPVKQEETVTVEFHDLQFNFYDENKKFHHPRWRTIHIPSRLLNKYRKRYPSVKQQHVLSAHQTGFNLPHSYVPKDMYTVCVNGNKVGVLIIHYKNGGPEVIYTALRHETRRVELKTVCGISVESTNHRVLCDESKCGFTPAVHDEETIKKLAKEMFSMVKVQIDDMNKKFDHVVRVAGIKGK